MGKDIKLVIIQEIIRLKSFMKDVIFIDKNKDKLLSMDFNISSYNN